MKRLLFFAMVIQCASVSAKSNEDTVLVDAKNITTKYLKPSVTRYLMYLKNDDNAVRNTVQFWTSTIETTNHNGKEAFVITYRWDDKDTIIHTVKSIVDKETFAPLYQEDWWKGRPGSTYDFVNKNGSIDGKPLSDADTARNRLGPWKVFKKATEQYTLTWHLDLEIFRLLPFKNNRVLLIPFYEPGSVAPKNEAYRVSSETIDGYDGQRIDCWVITHDTKIKTGETFWVSQDIHYISKKNRELVKMDQVINGKQQRYKVKLAYGK